MSQLRQSSRDVRFMGLVICMVCADLVVLETLADLDNDKLDLIKKEINSMS